MEDKEQLTASSPGSSSNELTEELEDALEFVANHLGGRVFPLDLAGHLGIHHERARYLLEELEKLGLLGHVLNIAKGTSWMLSSAGRAELVRRGRL